jgi:type IX secretion system PorP/SprF family membrane protein
MMKKIIVLLTIYLSVNETINAQQDPLLTHFFYNKMSYNPAATGAENGFSATSVYRNQWDKVDGAPNSAFLNLEGDVSRFIPGGVGLSFFHDAIGFNRQNNLMLNYSYPIKINTTDEIRAGLGIGMLNFGMNPLWVTSDPAGMDKSLPGNFSSTGLDLNFGLYYQSSKRFYAGLSLTHLNTVNIKHTTSLGNTSFNQIYPINSHLYIMGGYKTRNIGPGHIDGQTLIKTDFNFLSVDLNGRYVIDSLGYAGITFRNSDAISIMAAYFVPQIPNFTIGYSYDFTINKLSNISKGSHEILLRYVYYLPPPPVEISRHPRWL